MPKIQVGDYVSKAGIYTKPGVVTEKKEDGTVVIDTDPELIKKFHRHSNTNGLSVSDKERFNSIMDDIMKVDDNGERLSKLQQTIDELRADPASKPVADSLRNEQSQLIRLTRELPRVYDYNAKDIR